MEPAQAAQPPSDDSHSSIQEGPLINHPVAPESENEAPKTATMATTATNASSSDVMSDSEDILSEDLAFSSGFTSGEEESHISTDEDEPIDVTIEEDGGGAAATPTDTPARRSVTNDFVVDVLDLTQDYADENKPNGYTVTLEIMLVVDTFLAKVQIRMPNTATVEAVKSALIKSQPPLFSFDPRDLALGIDTKTVFENETVPFVKCHPIVEEMYQTDEYIPIIAFPAIQHGKGSIEAPPRKMKLDLKRQSIGGALRLSELFMKPNVIKEGFLGKKMKFTQKFEPRLVELRNDHNIYYYRVDPQAPPGTEPLLLGKIPLAISVVARHPEKEEWFTVLCGTKLVLFQAHTIPSAYEWVELLSRMAAEARWMYSADVEFEGWLTKKGEKVKSWKRRWCVLKNDHIYYYENQQLPRTDPEQYKGKIPLFDCIVAGDSEKENGFKIHTRDRTYFLEARDQLEARRWVKSIHICRKRLKALGLGATPSGQLGSSIPASSSAAIPAGAQSLPARTSYIGSTSGSPSSVPGPNGSPGPQYQFPDFDFSKLNILQRHITVCSEMGESDVEIAEHIDLRKLKRMLDEDQVKFFRLYMFYLRRMVANDRDPVGHLLAPASTATTPLPEDFPNHVDATFHFQDTSVTIKAPILLSFRAAIVETMTLMQRRSLVATDVAVDDFVVQIFGRRLHVVDSGIPLAALGWVRDRISRNKKLEFIIVPKSEIAKAVYGSAASFHSSTQGGSSSPQSTHKTTKMQKMVRQFKRVLDDSSKREKVRSNSIRDLNRHHVQPANRTASPGRPSADIKVERGFSIYDLGDLPFSVRILSIENFSHSFLASFYASQGVDAKEGLASKLNFYLEVSLHYAGEQLGAVGRTGGKLTPFWGETLLLEPIRTLPPETRVCFVFWCSLLQQAQPLAWVNLTLADYTGALRKGALKLPMWLVENRHGTASTPNTPNPAPVTALSAISGRLALGTSTCDVNSLARLKLHIEFPSPHYVMFYPDFNNARFANTLGKKRTTRTQDSAPASPQAAAAARAAIKASVTKSGQLNARITAGVFGQSGYNAQYQSPAGLRRTLSLSDRSGLGLSRTPSGSSMTLAKVASLPLPKPEPAPSTDAGEEDIDGGIHLNALPRGRLRSVQRPQLHKILKKDPLEPLTEQDRETIWFFRKNLSWNLEALPKLIMAADMRQPEHRDYIHRIVMNAQLLAPHTALQLLDPKFADSVVRSYAVQCLDQCSDVELCLYSLQLVQALKYEPFHVSALSSFLIERALHAPLTVGHTLLWHMQAEMHNPEVQARFGLAKEAILLGIPQTMRREFLDQVKLVEQLVRINHAITASVALAPLQRVELLRQALAELELPAKFSLPLSSSMVVKGLNVESCRMMDSSAFPFWLVFQNADDGAEPIIVIFKCGDDLRQDVLTLQMFTLMDSLWKDAGLDMQMSVYGCAATGESSGMIEVVMDSQTTAKIQKEAGGVIGALKKTPIYDWLRKHNAEEALWHKAQNTFMISCAAYCVATYVVGLGDRHNDNIMVTKHGHLFHIDFAHFLGNVMKFGIYTRERAPFVFTPEFLFVMGGETSEMYVQFKELCCQCYNVLRAHSNTFISLFALMLLTGLPQLNSAQDIAYLRRAFSTALTNTQADETFKRLIDESLQSKSTQINFTFHILAHLD